MKSILIIGPGKLGTSLYRALSESGGFHISLAGPAAFKMDDAAQKHLGKNYSAGYDAESAAKSDIIFITVPDGSITHVKDKLLGPDLSGRIILHTSGASSSDILADLKGQGALTGSFHPIQTFNRPFISKEIWENTVCSYEGDEQGKDFLQGLCGKLKARLLVVNKRQKLALHLAAVISANYLAGLLAWAENILLEEGVDKNYFKDIIYPISSQVMANYQSGETKDILSGPVLRGDIQTIQKHLDFLETKTPPDKNLYKALAELLLNNDEFNIQNRQELLDLLRK